jgi:PHS family inorganic phosphate transporter-like MFS transporter
MPACALAIFCLQRYGGKKLMFYGFITNAIAFLALGIVYSLYPDPTASGASPVKPYLKFTIFCASMFSLNWGPNLATYVVPLSAFPIEVRGTFHGLSAASGKAGAALGAFLYPVVISSLGSTGPQTIFFIQVAVNGLGALLAWRFISNTVREETSEEVYEELLVNS